MLIVAQRTMLSKTYARSSKNQGPRPRTRTLKAVQEAILEVRPRPLRDPPLVPAPSRAMLHQQTQLVCSFALRVLRRTRIRLPVALA